MKKRKPKTYRELIIAYASHAGYGLGFKERFCGVDSDNMAVHHEEHPWWRLRDDLQLEVIRFAFQMGFPESAKGLMTCSKRESVDKTSEVIPDEFRQNLNRADKRVNWRAVDEVLGWNGRKSVLCYGNAQTGKTRSVYSSILNHLRGIHPLDIDASRSFCRDDCFVVLDEKQILIDVSDAMSGRGPSLRSIDSKWGEAKILFFDDLDKVNLASGVTGQTISTLVFGTIKNRMARRRPTFISTNTTLDNLFGQAGVAMAESVIGRIEQDEHWMVVNFNQ